MKAPLSAVALYLEASGGKLPTPASCATVRDTIVGAIDVVDALLDYARAGAQVAPDAMADVGEVVAHALRAITLAPERKVDVRVEPELMVGCSRGALASIVGNLVRNAFLHGVDGGGRSVLLRAYAISDDCARIEVTDDGPGVPDALRANLRPVCSRRLVARGPRARLGDSASLRRGLRRQGRSRHARRRGRALLGRGASYRPDGPR